MTLTEALSTEHPDITQSAPYLPAWLRANKMPQLPAADGVQPTQQETYHLAGWIARAGAKVAPLVPAAWRDTLACLPFQKGVINREFCGHSFELADKLRGDAVRQRIREFIESYRGSGQELRIDLIELFLRLEGPAAIPALARLFTHQELERHFNNYQFLERANVPGQYGISPPVWAALWEPDARATLAGFHRRGFGFQPTEIRALAAHPTHDEVVRGLVLAIRSGAGECVRAFVLPEEPALKPGEVIVIGHASMIDATGRTKWAKRLAAPPPFDQWTFEAKTLDVSKCAADPLPLFAHLEARGWQRGPAVDGVIRAHTKAFPELGLTASLDYDGVPVAFGGAWTRQRIAHCRFEPHESAIATAAVAEDLEGLA